jgi:hypothetical protein
VYYYFDPKGQSEDSHRATLIATTLVVVMVSITVFGALTKPLLDFMLGGRGERRASVFVQLSCRSRPGSVSVQLGCVRSRPHQ